MDRETLVRFLDDASQGGAWLDAVGFEDPARAHTNLLGMARSGLPLELLTVVCDQFQAIGHLSDPDMAWNNLERFVAASRSPLALGALFERDPEALPTLARIFSTSQYLSDLLIRDPESFDLLRITDGQPVTREVLVEEICAEVKACPDDAAVMALLRRYKRRETLRIAYGDIVKHQKISVVTQQISFLADAICEGALQAAWRKWEEKRGAPVHRGRPARLVVLALGKLGGSELNYSSDIDLVFISDGNGKTNGDRSISNAEFFDRVVKHFVKLLTEPTELGTAYRVDLRLRPDGSQGTAAMGMEDALRYYDVSGRTWERQAYVKARPIAGDLELGQEFLTQLEPWVYRRYLSRADITGIKALKRRIERRSKRQPGDGHNVKTGHGGIRDIEFVIQFLQLLNGGDLPEIRTGNTLQAIARLAEVGCLTLQEKTILEKNYALLRNIEHRLQIMFDLQTHTLPDNELELSRLAMRLGYATDDGKSPLERFRNDFSETTALNRRILDHLLHDAFEDDAEADLESDLVLDPDPSEQQIQECLGRYGFEDVPEAYRNLMALAQERIPFLSTRRCRHFLASIASGLLQEIAKTPDPDFTLVNLSKVSDSLGGKGVLWELFSFNPPSMDLYVQLCATSPYLSGILTSNPGMIDELMDSLLLDRLPTRESLQNILDDLCRNAEDIEPILHSFKNAQHLRVGVRDILGKEDIRESHRALSDIAEVCLHRIASAEYDRLAEKHGMPMLEVEGESRQAELMILALGKLGGREPNYHSDLDVVFLYEADGQTRHSKRVRQPNATTNQHFFGQLGQRIIKVVTRLGPFGRLYELDPRLRPTGKSGSLAISLAEFQRYFSPEGQGQLWERQALCKARPIYGSEAARRKIQEIVQGAIRDREPVPEDADAIYEMRQRLQETASKHNLKRGEGGTVDIEFAVQMLQLRFGPKDPSVLQPGTLDALLALERAGAISRDDQHFLSESYRFLRSVESRLRLMNTTARHDLPTDELQLKKLSFLLGYGGGSDNLLKLCADYTARNRQCFNRLFGRQGQTALSS